MPDTPSISLRKGLTVFYTRKIKLDSGKATVNVTLPASPALGPRRASPIALPASPENANPRTAPGRQTGQAVPGQRMGGGVSGAAMCRPHPRTTALRVKDQ